VHRAPVEEPKIGLVHELGRLLLAVSSDSVHWDGMRVAIVMTGGLHPSGTREVMPSFLSLIERLARRHVVHAFTLRHLPEAASYPLAGAMVHDLGRPAGYWAQWRGLSRALRTHGPFDVLHGYWADPGGVLTAVAGRRMGIPTVVTCDSGEFAALPVIEYGLQRHARGRSIVRLACGLATRVHVTTRFMEELARIHGVDPVRLPVGIDPARWPLADPSEGPPWRLLQVASLNRVKDHGTLLCALARVRRSHDAHLDLVGEDTLDGQLAREATTLGLSDVVHFHGFVPHDALPPFYRAAHLYVQSSLHEAGGASVLEAAASGVPVVGTRAGHVSDWAPDAAWAVPPGDADALADGIVQLLDDRARRRALAAAARQFVVSHDIDWTARELTALYTDAIAHA
jgi:glycosyltransferase involved in cell wall biosynthesis